MANGEARGGWQVTALVAVAILALGLGGRAGAQLYDDVVKPTFIIKFKKGTFEPVSMDDIHQAALWARTDGKMLQVEGFSCIDDGKGDKPTHRIDQADKRATVVMKLLIKYGAPAKSVYTVSYEYGNCVAVITVLDPSSE